MTTRPRRPIQSFPSFLQVLKRFLHTSQLTINYCVFQGDLPPLSPLPVVRHTPVSPRRRISSNHSVYINNLSPVKGSTAMSPRKPLPYYFNRSPAKVKCNIFHGVDEIDYWLWKLQRMHGMEHKILRGVFL